MPDSAVFQTKYPGQCGRCDNRIQVGEHVHYDTYDLVWRAKEYLHDAADFLTPTIHVDAEHAPGGTQ